MSMAAHIRRHIWNLPDLEIFASKHLLQYATRAVVDSVLFHMVKDGDIIRLARGVFVKPHPDVSKITLQEIVEFKASVFDRRLLTDTTAVARELKLPVRGSVNTFAINGHTSRFTALGHFNTVVKLKGICPRKMKESRVGLAMRALWHMGKDRCTARNIRIATSQFTHDDRQEQRTVAPIWMPGWLHDIFFKLRNHQKPRTLTPRVRENGEQYWCHQVQVPYHLIDYMIWPRREPDDALPANS